MKIKREREERMGLNKDFAEEGVPKSTTMRMLLPAQAKITITAVLTLVNAYVIYAMIACYITWLRQPRFVLPDSSNTSSLGFIVTLLIYAGIFLITLSALIVTSVLFYKKRRKTLKTIAKTE